MLTVTDGAKEVLHEILGAARRDVPAGLGIDTSSVVLRLVAEAQGLAFALDVERDGDQVIAYEDETVLVIGEDVGQLVDGYTLDVHTHDDGGQHLELHRGQPGESHA
jgi:hypothetical protein